MKIWAIDVSIDLKNCDGVIVKSKEKIQEYAIQLCKKLNVDRHGDCIINQFTNYERQAIQLLQPAQFGFITGYFIGDCNVGHVNLFYECPYDINTFIEFTQQFFGTEEVYVRRDNKYL